MWAQRELTLKARVRRCLFRSARYRRLIEAQRRGCHLVTDEIARAVPELRDVAVGLAHLFLKHTSASLSINENCDPDVREVWAPAPCRRARDVIEPASQDMETTLNRLVPDDTRLYTHTAEGPDDMPAHVKSSLLGCQLTVPSTTSTQVLSAMTTPQPLAPQSRTGA